MRNVPSSPDRPSSVSSVPIAENEAVLAQLVRDGEHRLPQALVVSGQESEDRCQER